MKNRDLNPFHGHRTGVLKIKDTLNLLKPPPWGAFAYSLLGCLSNIKNKDNKFSPALSLFLLPHLGYFSYWSISLIAVYTLPRDSHIKSGWLISDRDEGRKRKRK